MEQNHIRHSEEPYHSFEINELSGALAKAQAEFKTAVYNKNNPFFKSKYADLEACVNASRPALNKYNISIAQPLIAQNDGTLMLYTKMTHSSGQWMHSRVKINPAKNTPQDLSSYTSYMKRMAYCSLVGVVTGDEDDDGEVAMVEHRNYPQRPAPQKEETFEPITKEQLEEFEIELVDNMDIAQQILDGFKIQSISEMPKSKYSASIRKVRELKFLKSGTK